LIVSSNLGASSLPFLAGLGLALLASPLRGIRRFAPSLFILALLPLMRALQFPYPTLLTYSTAWFAQLTLLLSGLPVKVHGAVVSLPGGGVLVAAGCSGLSAMLQLFTISLIFAIAFPMRHRWQNLLMALCAIGLAFLVNAFRVALLALIISSKYSGKQFWFELFHLGWFSLIFPAISAYLFVSIYTFWLEHQVAFLEKHER
jgi:cyanoexosortase A